MQDKLYSHQSLKLKDDKNEEMMSAAGKGAKYFYHQSYHCSSYNYWSNLKSMYIVYICSVIHIGHIFLNIIVYGIVSGIFTGGGALTPLPLDKLKFLQIWNSHTFVLHYNKQYFPFKIFQLKSICDNGHTATGIAICDNAQGSPIVLLHIFLRLYYYAEAQMIK